MKKICKKCGEEKDVSDFYANKSCKDGIGGKCKKCHNAYSIEWAKNNRLKTLKAYKKHNEKRKKDDEYIIRKRFYGMHFRCNNKKYHETHPSYIGCSVHPDWGKMKDNPNGLRNFINWSLANGFDKSLELDKDGRVAGNKVYGPDTCQYITREENIALIHGKPDYSEVPF